ncbi:MULTISPECIES: sulfurtransferase TusA family protein [Acinetobacter]|jgi:tRNA 2-thiouridine synthesizing protein A|uniref:Sulfurtransferase TusA family protein n=1 Tax=Acinetobacter chengduensis TaxID=2420890 RepID=A0ABX9TW19_9GAMM|nr:MULTISPECIES: sulfurtransferase TusA family protein [Acinetobacter]MBI1450552.1 sulfurtransferase TusA family protein [Acinetobacter sp. FL51]RKG39879.1 sulfurtransferase TusA family protein [Acinetobacter sp. WCHAc060007]RLL22037.1 sulfurtransferase TusA family protein [Acinetobacter chengduensis]
MSDFQNTEAYIVDAMGKPCPMPLLMLKKALKSQTGNLLLLKSSDPHSQQDVSRYCEIHNLNFQLNKVSDSEFHYLIES